MALAVASALRRRSKDKAQLAKGKTAGLKLSARLSVNLGLSVMLGATDKDGVVELS